MAVFTTPVLDDFNRADENPISFGGKWAVWTGRGGGCSVKGNQLALGPGGINNTGSSIWMDSKFGPNFEMSVTFSTLHPSGSYYVYMYTFIQNVANSSSDVKCEVIFGGASHTVSSWTLFLPSSSINASPLPSNLSVGDQIGLRGLNGVVESWHKPVSASWRRVAVGSYVPPISDGWVGFSSSSSLGLDMSAIRLDNLRIANISPSSPGALEEMGLTGFNDTLSRRAWPEPKTNTLIKPRPIAGQVWPRRR